MDIKKTILKENIKLINKATETLKLSLEKCKKIGIKDEYTFEELESFDSLTSKFARTSDIYTQKILRSVFMLLREPNLTLIDTANRGEKLDMIISAEDLLIIRDLRNSITHEYIEEAIFEIFKNVLELSGILLENIQKTINFIDKKNLL